MLKKWSYGEEKNTIVLSEPPKQKLRITGHRISGVLGLNPYQSAFGCWCEITKLVKLPFEDSKYTIFGKAVESKLIDMVRKEFPNVMSIEEYYGANIDRYKWNNFVEDSNIFGGIIDAVATKNDLKTITMIVECKSSSKPQMWENNNVPVDYLLQGGLYSYLKRLDRVLFICCFPQEMDYARPDMFTPTKDNTVMVLKKLKDIVVEMPDKSLITFDEAIKYCEDWWNKYIETGISPPFDEKVDKEYLDIIRTSTPTNDNTLDELCEYAKTLTDEIEELQVSSGLDSKEKELKIIKDSIKEKMMAMLNEGETKLLYKQYKLNGSVSEKLDTKSLKEKYPKIYDQFVTTSISFKLTENKEESENK